MIIQAGGRVSRRRRLAGASLEGEVGEDGERTAGARRRQEPAEVSQARVGATALGAGPVIRAFAHPGRARGAVEHGDEVVIALAHEPVPALVVDIQRPRDLLERREWVRGRHAGDEVLGSALSTLVLRLPPAAGAVLERDFGLGIPSSVVRESSVARVGGWVDEVNVYIQLRAGPLFHDDGAADAVHARVVPGPAAVPRLHPITLGEHVPAAVYAQLERELEGCSRRLLRRLRSSRGVLIVRRIDFIESAVIDGHRNAASEEAQCGGLGRSAFMTLEGLRTAADCEEGKSETQLRNGVRTRTTSARAASKKGRLWLAPSGQ